MRILDTERFIPYLDAIEKIIRSHIERLGESSILDGFALSSVDSCIQVELQERLDLITRYSQMKSVVFQNRIYDHPGTDQIFLFLAQIFDADVSLIGFGHNFEYYREVIFSSMFPSLRTFWITSVILIIAVILLAVYLYYDCMANTGCSGESGIAIVMLGLPWVMYPSFRVLGFFGSAGTALMINMILLSFFVQILRWIYLFFFPGDTSSPPKGSA